MSKKIIRENFKSLAARYDLDIGTFMLNIKIIRGKLDASVGRSNYRRLTPKQVQMITEHLGEWGEE